MAEQDTQLKGPDFTKGFLLSELGDRRPVLGHAGGEAVILAQCDGKVFAVGSSCPHYGAPLADGTIVNGTIRCPWHHSAFDLATGAMVRPPALNDLPCWNVQEKDGLVIVGDKREPVGNQEKPSSGAHPSSVVIVGGGASGLVAADTLRRSGYAGPVTIVSADTATPVDRPNLSKDYLAGNAPEEWMPLRPDEWYAEQSITLLPGRRATALDTQAHRLTLDDESSLEWGSLLLATGAEPIRLSLGEALPVHYLRTLADSRAIITAAATAHQAVVIGASFIGLEVAASLRARGLEVTVVAPESQPLERVLGAVVGDFIRELHETKGVKFRLGRTAKATVAEGLQLDDGSIVPADLVVAGVGVRPVLGLADSSGLKVDRGVMVNQFLETSVAGVFAAGDIARWPDARSGKPIRVEHWVVAERQAQTAARNILGARERFDAVPFFWSVHYDITISYVGHAELPDRTEIDGDLRGHDCTIRYFEGGRVAAVATIGRDRASLAAEAEMEREIRGRTPEQVPSI